MKRGRAGSASLAPTLAPTLAVGLGLSVVVSAFVAGFPAPWGAASAVAPATPRQPGLLIRDVTVVDVASGSLLPGRTVVVEGDRIAAVVRAGSPGAARAAGASTVIDGRGLFLIPGLWDMHAHVLPTSDAPDRWWEPDPDSAARLLLANGVTGVRDMWGSLEAARRWRSEAGPRPELVAPGGIIDGPYPWFPGLLPAVSAAEARRLVDSLAAGGADFIKVYNTLPPQLLRVIAERAAEHGLIVAGHVPNAMPALEAAEAGMAGFEHLHGVLEGCSREEAWLLRDNVAYLESRAAGRLAPGDDREYFRRLLDSQDDRRCARLIDRLAALRVAQTPTLVAHSGPLRLRDADAADDPRLAYVPADAARFWQPSTYDATRGFGADDWQLAERRLRRMREVVAEMQRAGVPILAGSDYHPTLAFTFPGFSLHEELRLLVEAGLTAPEALRAATLAPARFLRGAGRTGLVETGRAADLVLLAANPLEDIRATREIRGVVRAGRWLPADTLDAWKRIVADRYRTIPAGAPPPLPAGAERAALSGRRRGAFRYTFLVDLEPLRAKLPTFVRPTTARAAAGADPALLAFLQANPHYADRGLATLEIGSYETSESARRSSIATWWLAAEETAVLGKDAPAATRTVVELGRWAASGPGSARVWARSYATGTWAFHLEALELTVDVVCRPGGARWPEPAVRHVLIWPGTAIPNRYHRQIESGQTVRDCAAQLTAEGLSPLAAALKEAPYVAGVETGARLVEGGSWRRGTFITD